MKTVYLDHAAVSPMSFRARVKLFLASSIIGNPGSLHGEGVFAKRALLRAREVVARVLHAHKDEIVFTRGGTEGNNIAIRGALLALRGARGEKDFSGMHMVTTAIEHPSALFLCEALEKEGLLVSYVQPEEDGSISPARVKDAMRENTVLVSVMHTNNETGSVNDIKQIAKVVRDFAKDRGSKKALMHTDACQAPLYYDLDTRKLGIDLLTINSAKVSGPRGVGALWVRRGVELTPLFFGGSGERALAPGTEPLPEIISFADALAGGAAIREREYTRLSELRAWFIKELRTAFPSCLLNGTAAEQSPFIVNVSFPPYESEEVVFRLSAKGIMVSGKSACKSEDDSVSYVIQALGEAHRAESAIRVSMGRSTRKRDLAYTIKELKKIFETINSFNNKMQ